MAGGVRMYRYMADPPTGRPEQALSVVRAASGRSIEPGNEHGTGIRRTVKLRSHPVRRRQKGFSFVENSRAGSVY